MVWRESKIQEKESMPPDQQRLILARRQRESQNLTWREVTITTNDTKGRRRQEGFLVVRR